MIKEQLNILINLAASDKQVGEKEAATIHMIARANGISKEEVETMLKAPQPIGDLTTYTEDQKFENLYHLIQLMKADGHVFKSEVVFCQNIAERLGYSKAVVEELSSKIYSDPTITSDRKALMARAHKYLKR